ncbi:protein Shroom2-like [Amblyraja radiata]|uniref:protein Shroom2-like n=1 Tax=Amblyraja radiata TaxID=386614 RepID=UPI0014040CDE|nr:protein Shroom2-like [Amblyraja radiata]
MLVVLGGVRGRSHPHSLPQQNEPALVDSDSVGQLNISSSPARPRVAKLETSLEVDADWKYRNRRAVNVAVGKSRYERPRGMSLDYSASSSFGKWTSRMSRSTDQLGGGQPTGQDDAVQVPPPLEMPSPERNWVKLRRGVKWQASQGAAAFQRGGGICKSRPTSSSEEPLAPTSPSPSPRSPMERARARARSLSSLPARGHEVPLERSSAVSGNCGTDHGSASDNIPVQPKPSPLRPENIFQASPSLEKTANYETGATEWPMSGENLLSTVDFVPMKPAGYDTEDDIKVRLADLASSPVCPDSIVEMTLPASMAKSEIKGGNSHPSPFKDPLNRHETSRQRPTDWTNSCVHPRMRTKSPEELRTEKLIKEIIDEDRSLAEILDPNPTTKTIMDLVEDMFQEDTLVLEACQRRGQLYSQTTEAETKRSNTKEIQLPSLLGSDTGCKAAAATVTLMQDINRERGDWPTDITDKKRELIVAIRWKLRKLHEAQAGLQEDIKVNDSLGDDIEACVGQVCNPNEMQKYESFVADLDKVMGLLLCLSSRLVRVESALSKVNESTDVEEKQSLNERHQTLSHRHEGARGLKVHQDHRERMTFRILSNYLNEIQLQHCHHFVQMRKALIIKQKEIEENLRLTEEQLGFLENSL